MNYDHELIVDFLGEYDDAQIEAEKILKSLDQSLDIDELNTLFRVIHSIKGNFRMVELNPLSDLIHILENSLSQIRDNERQIHPGYTLLISSTIEQCKEITKQVFIGQDKSSVIEQLTQVYTVLFQSSAENYPQTILASLETVDKLGEYGNEYSSQAIIDFFKQHEVPEKEVGIKDDNRIEKLQPVKNELDFFYQLTLQIESYFPYWKGRSDNIFNLVSQMNEAYGFPIDPQQLQAAVYLHDIGMSFIPPQKIHTTSTLNDKDKSLMHGHCETGFQWLNLIPGWQDAALMIHQHHEHFNGNGYPLKLTDKQICAGAKVIAIGDTFASITGQEKTGSQSRPIMHAVSEINQGAGHQFDPEWVAAFNQVIRNLKK